MSDGSVLASSSRRKRFEALVGVLVAVAFVAACSPRLEDLILSGKQLDEALETAESAGYVMKPMDEFGCDWEVRENVLPTGTEWIPPDEDVPPDYAAAMRVMDIRAGDGDVVYYCGRLDLSDLPPISSGTVAFDSAVKWCDQAELLMDRPSPLNLSLNEMSAIYDPSAAKELSENPRFADIQQMYFYLYNFYDFTMAQDIYVRNDQVYDLDLDFDKQVLSLGLKSRLGGSIQRSWIEARDSLVEAVDKGRVACEAVYAAR